MSQVLPAAGEKPRFVAAMFGRIAKRYDLMNTLMTAGQDAHWRRAVADALSTQHSTRYAALSTQLGTQHAALSTVLDVGTGTGKLAATIAERVPRARVVGVDFADPMLRTAQRSLPRAVRLVAADALRLPFADASFDGVASAFVVRNLADLRAGLAEQRRVLRPGGRLIILETTPGPTWKPIRPLFRLYFRGLVPLLGALIAGDAAAYTYLPESVAAFRGPERLAEIVRACGLSEVTTRRLALGSVVLVAALR